MLRSKHDKISPNKFRVQADRAQKRLALLPDDYFTFTRPLVDSRPYRKNLPTQFEQNQVETRKIIAEPRKWVP